MQAQHYTIYNGDQKYEFDIANPSEIGTIFESRRRGTWTDPVEGQVLRCKTTHSSEVMDILVKFLQVAHDYPQARAFLDENRRLFDQLDRLADDLWCRPLKEGIRRVTGMGLHRLWEDAEEWDSRGY